MPDEEESYNDGPAQSRRGGEGCVGADPAQFYPFLRYYKFSNVD